MLYIGSDHGGFRLKENLKKFLKKEKIDFLDLGPNKLNPKDDYVDYAIKVARKVSNKPNTEVGILICRSGQGVCITANKFKNVRAALVWNVGEAKASKNDDMSNVLCLPADYVKQSTAQKIVKAWLSTEYSKAVRHVRRIKKIGALEKRK